MDINALRTLLTVLGLLLFLGIVGWTYSAKRKHAFEEAARLDDEDHVAGHRGSVGRQHN